MALKPPVEVPQGAIRVNTDSQKLEFYAQDQWWEMATDTPILNGGARGLIAGGDTGKKIDYFNIASQGNAEDFGDLAEVTYQQATYGSNTRSIFSGGAGPATNPNDVIEYVTTSSLGNTSDFGNLSQARRNPAGASNSTRGIVAGGGNGPETTVYNTIDYVTIASTGDAKDFGDLTRTNMVLAGGINSPFRAVFAGGAGTGPNYNETNVIDYITITTTGNAYDFGDLKAPTAAPAGCSNTVRGIIVGGATNIFPGNVMITDIRYITIASTGNTTDFGDTTVATNYGNNGATSSSIRGVFCCGYVAPAPSATQNTIEHIMIATTGDSVDFGDAVTAERYRGSISNAHGGL